jgi:hypothetical protein
LPATSMGNIQIRRSSNGSKVSQVEEALAVQSLMARPLRMWDWDSKDGKYRVRLDGQWIEVPPDALVTVSNKYGLPVVWPYKDYEGKTQIRCFIPGAGG